MERSRTGRVVPLLATVATAALGALGCSEEAGGPGDHRAAPPPSWDSVGVERAWLREGFGEVCRLGVADFDGDGSDDVVLGGRGLALLDANARSTHHPRWSLDWIAPAEQPLAGGDNAWVYDLALVNANDDGVPDLLVVTTEFDAYLVDGADGTPIWHRLLEGDQLPTGFARFDGDGDGVPEFFPVGGRAAYAGATGETLWQAPIDAHAQFAATARDGGTGAESILVATATGQIGTGSAGDGEPENTLHALTTDGTSRWTVPLGGSPAALAVGDLDGDGRDDAVVTTWDGGFQAFDHDGEPLFDLPFTDAWGSYLSAVDLDGDGIVELLVGLLSFVEAAPRLVVVAADGTVTGGVELLVPAMTAVAADLDGVPPLEVLVGSGDFYLAGGEAVAFRMPEGPESPELWRVPLGQAVSAFAPATVDGTRVVLAGDTGGWVHALSPGTGEAAWHYAGGTFVMELAAADLDGDGADEVVSGDDAGNVMISSPADGSQRLATRLDVGWRGDVRVLAAAPFTTGGVAEIVAGGIGHYPRQDGYLERFDVEGYRRFAVRLGAEPTSLDLVDLDADGQTEVVVGERTFEGECRVTAREADGTIRWRTPLSPCEFAHLAAGDVDGDGLPEIAYGTQSLFTAPEAALLAPDGTPRWRIALEEDAWWVEAVAGGTITGGYTSEARGHVTRRGAADGAVLWRAFLPGLPAAETPEMAVSGGSQSGALVPDLDGDGLDEIAAGSEAGAVHLLDGATGLERWRARVEPEGLDSTRRHFAGPIVHVPGTEAAPPFLAVGQSEFTRKRSRTLVFDLDGNERGSIAHEGEAHGIAAVRFDGGRMGAAVGAGLGVYALEPRPLRAP